MGAGAALGDLRHAGKRGGPGWALLAGGFLLTVPLLVAVVLALVVAVLGFIIWLSQVSGEDNKEYDIFFKQAVDGLAKGSAVSFNGVPVGRAQEEVDAVVEVWRDTSDPIDETSMEDEAGAVAPPAPAENEDPVDRAEQDERDVVAVPSAGPTGRRDALLQPVEATLKRYE